jgi:predicted phosphoribosyltransferase
VFSADEMFADRHDAGRQLADALMRFKPSGAVVLALPRGGVPVGFEVARALGAPLDVVLVRKIGAPGHPELGLGAVVDGHDPQLVLNEDVVAMVRPSDAYIKVEENRQLEEIDRRRKLYRDDRPGLDLEGRTVIVVDDGIATGGTVKAVLKALSRTGAAYLVLAVPVAPRDTLDEMRADVDEVVCLAVPEPFYAVGDHYADFSQTSDREVVELLRAAGPPSIATGPEGTVPRRRGG